MYILIIISYFILIGLFFWGKGCIFQKTGSEVAGLIGLIGIGIWVVLGSTVLILAHQFYGFYFLGFFILIQFALTINDNFFYFIGALEKKQLHYYTLLTIFYAIFLYLVSYDLLASSTALMIIFTVILFWAVLFLIAKNNIIAYCKFLGSDTFNVAYWIHSGKYKSQNSNQDLLIFQKIVTILCKKGCYTALDNILDSLIFEDYTSNMSDPKIAFIFLDNYLNSISNHSREKVVKRFLNRGGHGNMTVINNEQNSFRVWIDYAQQSTNVRNCLEAFLDNMAHRLEVFKDISEMKTRYNAQNSTLKLLVSNTTFEKDTKVYQNLDLIFQLLK